MEDIISELDLVDIPPKIGKYTSTNRRSGNNFIATRLDRFLIHNNWLLKGLDFSSFILAQGELYHHLISLLLTP